MVQLRFWRKKKDLMKKTEIIDNLAQAGIFFLTDQTMSERLAELRELMVDYEKPIKVENMTELEILSALEEKIRNLDKILNLVGLPFLDAANDSYFAKKVYAYKWLKQRCLFYIDVVRSIVEEEVEEEPPPEVRQVEEMLKNGRISEEMRRTLTEQAMAKHKIDLSKVYSGGLSSAVLSFSKRRTVYNLKATLDKFFFSATEGFFNECWREMVPVWTMVVQQQGGRGVPVEEKMSLETIKRINDEIKNFKKTAKKQR